MIKLNRKHYPHAIIINSHLTGLIGYLSAFKNVFLLITPLNLLLSSVLLIKHQQEKNKAFWLFTFGVMACGFFIEVIGVQTGVIFGKYSYGSTLGLSLFKVPLVMGLNWFNLVYSTGILLNKTLKINTWFKSLIGASILVLLDFFIEPVAMKYNFWNWNEGQIPAQNYISWFIISFLFLMYFFHSSFKKNNPLVIIFLLVQFSFFVVLRMI